MVNDAGQLYTIEGFAAAILMVVTAYLVVSTTTVITPQDVHIIDMQLQQLGSDALAMMDTPDNYGMYSPLTNMIINNSTTNFQNGFLTFVNNATNIDSAGYNDRLNYTASFVYSNSTGQTNTYPFGGSTYYRENAVKVTRWVYIPPFNKTGTGYPVDMKSGENQTVLLEVLLWRE